MFNLPKPLHSPATEALLMFLILPMREFWGDEIIYPQPHSKSQMQGSNSDWLVHKPRQLNTPLFQNPKTRPLDFVV